ncbi:hypothetical protein [Alienimonas chondri]|uniref:Sulfur globule protein n=1 Tax=Alienimonas chondri TaxID=2681879 RepID=A0ABX1VGS3_9PLAN|nr:hypothetical protein [Alienimonas chondri]NNJ27327.1 hypothetical protein [Alienimonas chondri]
MTSRLIPKIVAAGALLSMGLLAAPSAEAGNYYGHRGGYHSGHYGVPAYGYNHGRYRGSSYGYHHGYRNYGFNRGYRNYGYNRGFGYGRGYGYNSRGLTIGTGNFFLNIRR